MMNQSDPETLAKTARAIGVTTVGFTVLYCAVVVWVLASDAPSMMALPFLPLLWLIGFMYYQWRLAIGRARAARAPE